MKKLILAGAMLAALPAFATTYNFSAVAKSQVSSTGATAMFAIDDSTMMLTGSITTVGNAFSNGLVLNCCSQVGTQPAFAFSSTGQAIGTSTYSINLGSAASYDASFLSANGGTASSAFAALMGSMTVANGAGGTIANLRAFTSPTQSFTGQVFLAPVPEPTTYAMLALGLGLVGLRVRKQARA